MPNDSIRYSKQISDQGRERSAEVRRERATLKEHFKAGEIAPVDVLNDESRVAAKIRMFAFPKNCPGVGAVGARTVVVPWLHLDPAITACTRCVPRGVPVLNKPAQPAQSV